MGEIKKQSISNTILSYIGAFIGFLSLIYVQPYFLGKEKIGLLKLIYNFSIIVAMIMPLGMGNVTMRFFPKFKNDKSKHNGYFGLLLLSVSIGALIIGVFFVFCKDAFQAFYSDNPKFITYYYYCFGFSYVYALISVFNLLSTSLLKTTFTVFLNDIYTRIGVILIIFLYYFNIINELGLVISYITIFVFQLILLLLYLYKLKAISLKINWSFFKSLDRKVILIFALVMTFGSFASLGIKYIDGLILGHYVSNEILGIYSICVFIPTILEIPFNSLERIALPKIAHAWNINDIEEVGKIYEMSSRYLFFIGGVLFCCLYAGIDFIFEILPSEYEIGKKSLLVIAICSLFNLLTGVNTLVISLSKKYIVTTVLLALLIVIGVTTNILLIPIYGIRGAAIATFIAIGLFNLLKYLYILIRFKMQPFSKHTLYVLGCILVALIFIFIIPDSLHPILRACIGCSITIILFSIMNIKFKTIEEVNKLFKRFKLIK